MATPKEQHPKSFVLNENPMGMSTGINIYPSSFHADGFWRETLEYQIGANRKIIIKPKGGGHPTEILPEELQNLRGFTKEKRDKWLTDTLEKIITAGVVAIQEIKLPSTRK